MTPTEFLTQEKLTNSVVFIGIDNGKTGAVAFGMGNRNHFSVQLVLPTPTSARDGKRENVSFIGARQLLAPYQHLQGVVVYESSRAMPRQGAFAAYDAGANDATWFAVFDSLQITPLVVGASTWQAQMFAQKKTKRDTKELAIAQASKLVLSESVLLKTKRSRKADHNRADAVCLAAFGYRKWLAGDYSA